MTTAVRFTAVDVSGITAGVHAGLTGANGWQDVLLSAAFGAAVGFVASAVKLASRAARGWADRRSARGASR